MTLVDQLRQVADRLARSFAMKATPEDIAVIRRVADEIERRGAPKVEPRTHAEWLEAAGGPTWR